MVYNAGSGDMVAGEGTSDEHFAKIIELNPSGECRYCHKRSSTFFTWRGALDQHFVGQGELSFCERRLYVFEGCNGVSDTAHAQSKQTGMSL